MNYNHQELEKKWQAKWENDSGLWTARDYSDRPKYYCLDMFPYPSGDGLHVGHVESYTATDIISRYLRLKGYNVLHPQGWDAFGLPAENYAIKTGSHPDITTHKNITNFTRQIKNLGFSYDWSREIDTSLPEYYKWTQWFFLLLYKNGLAYKQKAKVNWCPKCQTVLANEQAESGQCERCHSRVEQKDLEQWFFKITDFIETRETVSGLLDGLDKLDWPESIKAAQRNWIGRSEGAEINFKIDNANIYFKVYTTRIDTIFGCTYCVIAPENNLIWELKDKIENWEEVFQYIQKAKDKTELERTQLIKEKTGVELKGIKAINPFNNEKISIFVADYVLGHYGTGAVMAVPAHDERDFEFAQKFGLEIRQSITPNYEDYEKTVKVLKMLKEINEEAVKRKIKFWLLGGLAIPFYSRIIYRAHNDIDLVVKNDSCFDKIEVLFEDLGFKKEIKKSNTGFIFKKNSLEINIGLNKEKFATTEDFKEEQKNFLGISCLVLSKKFIKEFKKNQLTVRKKDKDKIDWEYINGKVFTEDGYLVNSGNWNGLPSALAREKMIIWLKEKGIGKKKINYRLRDWLVSRQRYWGAPIPIIYCDNCGEVPVPERDLPVILPTDVDFKPTGESPLARSQSFHNVFCPKCGVKARRESDTMDTFVCSSWYYFRYTDPHNNQEFASKENIKYWLPVDLYVGGAEHAVLHLLYARFFTKVLKRLKYIDFDEPFLKLRNQGLILAEDGRKMSKSLGNVINPDDVVAEWGADTLRIFEMFMGPLEDAKPWQTNGIIGVRRFLENVWKLTEKKLIDCQNGFCHCQESGAITMIHKTIKKVTEDIDNLHFNTAISQMMVCVNFFLKMSEVPRNAVEKILILLSPFAPHLTEELWERLGHTKSIFKESWPKYDLKFIKENIFKLVLQINGKTRGIIEASVNISDEDAKKIALENEKIKKWVVGKDILKIIYVKEKLVNIVVK